MYKIICGKYCGRIGTIKSCKDPNNVMFYPIEGEYPYRVCLKKTDVVKI